MKKNNQSKFLVMRIFSFFLIFLSNLYTASPLKWDQLEIISADSLKKHICFLGNDSLEGRGTGTAGELRAAKYLANYFKYLKLKSPFPDDSFFQPIPMHGSTPLPESQLQLHLADSVYQFELKRDYLLYQTGSQTFIPQPVPLVFVGYGIIAPEYDYNDYQTLNIEGKIVIFLSGEPPSQDNNYFNGAEPTIYAYPESKQRIAIARGAVGSILIPTAHEAKRSNWRSWVDTFEFENVTLAYSVTGNLSLVMNPNAAQKLFYGAKFNLSQIFEMASASQIQSFSLTNSLSFKGAFISRDFFANNIIGILEGKLRPPNDRYLLISAHYDHLGIGRTVNGDSIYNGVFDNAAGVAAVLEIARAFTSSVIKPRNSVIFLLTTGEERGLLGSSYYVDNPIIPLYKTIANVNIDGLAMFDNFNDVVAFGTEYSSLRDHLNRVTSSLNLKVSPLSAQFSGFESFTRSDQIRFASAGIPAILIAEGLNYQNQSTAGGLSWMINWMETIYHTPFDDLDQEMNFNAARQHARVLFAFCYWLGMTRDYPVWKPGAPFINQRLRSIAEKR
jgi:hypothetical protein